MRATSRPDLEHRFASRSGIFGWLLFDWAAQPVFTLVTTFVFGPFFARRLAESPEQGQALWGFAAGAAGLTIALLAPVLGSVADASGRRKPWIAFFSAVLVAGCLLLWWAEPGAPNAVLIALAGFMLATIGAEFATAFTNAMMPTLAPPERLGRLSGLGWATGYAGGLVSLALMLALVVASPETGLTLAGSEPLLGLDPGRGEGDRASGPLSAVWYAIFVLPLFLFTPDAPPGMPMMQAARAGLRELRETFAHLRRHRDAFLYLVAHMVYTDGLAALFAFGGIYATGVFGWSAVEIGAFGILLTISGAIGAVLGGRLDDRLGPKRVVLGSLIGMMAAGLGLVSITAERVLFVLATAPPQPGDGLFASTPERLYLALGLVIGALAGPLQSASRTLLVRLAPPDRLTQFFGLYALSGKVTSFLGPALVGVATALAASQRAGVSVLLAFFAFGAVLLLQVRTPPH